MKSLAGPFGVKLSTIRNARRDGETNIKKYIEGLDK